jgi:flagellar hook-associated protein 1
MFQGLSTALTALYANQQALDTTGNNIANVNTEGYSRQSVMMDPASGQTVPSFWTTGSRVGTGVNVTNIVRLRDEFLDNRSLTEHGTSGNLTQMASTYNTLELTFKEPSDTGIQEQLAKFWASFDDVANNPTDVSARTSVIEQAKTLVNGLQQASSDLDELSTATLTGLKNNVKQLNAYAKSVADLNQAIQSAYQGGSTPNALLDQRDLLVSKMSDMAGVSVQQTQNGSIAVSVGGVPIVRDNTTRTLQVDDSGSPVQLRWDGDHDPDTQNEGPKALVTGGTLLGQVTTLNTTIPKYKTLVDNVATNLISTVNSQHAAGLDAYGNPGGAFFTGTNASTIDVSSTLAADPKLFAAAGAGGGSADQENARKLAALADSQTGPDNQYRLLVNTLGVESQRATNQADIQSSIVQSVDSARDSVSGVSLDEEMANMVKFQKAYSASAKYLNVMNDVLDTLINLVR